MPFKFLKYLQPTHYFQLNTNTDKSVFPKVDALPVLVMSHLEQDNSYSSLKAREYDLSWQAIQNGYIGDVATYENFANISVQDNYHFIRKYFNKAWVFYVLLLRLLSFKNPFKEISGWYKTKDTSRVKIKNIEIYDLPYKNFKSKLIESNPIVSVVIPTLNRYNYLKDVLRDLEQQEYTNFEVIVVDQTEKFQKDFYRGWKLDLRYWFQEEKALWLARNEAIKVAKGDYILLYDDDSLIKPNWIIEHLKCLDYFNADISSGVSLSITGAEVPANYAFFRRSDQIDTGNVLIKKEVFKKIGLFDRQFEKQRMGDGEFGLRAHLNGFLNVSNPYAVRIHLKAGKGGLRDMGSWDAFRPSNFFAPRPIPSVLYFFRTYFGNKAAKLVLLRTIPLSIFPYQFKKNKPLLLLGVFVSLLLLPLVFYQVFKSWRLASVKIKAGGLIEKLS